MPGKRNKISPQNLVRNLIISLIAVIITIYFYYRPFDSRRNIFRQSNNGNIFLDKKEGSPTGAQSKNNSENEDGDYEILYIEGMKNYTEGNLSQAASLLEKALKIKKTEEVNKSIQKIYNLLALKKIEEGAISDARIFYDKAIAIAPLKTLILEKANTYTLTGEPDKAVLFLEKFRQNFKNDADYIVVLSNILYESGKPAMAYENLVDILNKVNAHTSAQMLKERIEDKYSIIDINLMNGKKILSFGSEIKNGKLAENFIYSVAGEVYSLLSSVYAISISKKINLSLSSTGFDSIPLTPGYNTNSIDSIYIPVELLMKKKNLLKKTLKYLITKKALSITGKGGVENILYEGIALKEAGYFFWGRENEKYLDNIQRSDFSKALETAKWPESDKNAGIYKILSVSLVDFLLIKYSGKMISDIVGLQKNGLSLKKAFNELSGKKEDELLNMWMKYFKNQTGRI